MLLALTRPSRSADLARLSLAGFKTTPEGAVFVPAALAKQSTANKAIKDFFFPRFTENVRLCPVHSLTLYIERTRQLRGTSTQLFIAIIKPHLPVTTSTVARWLKQVIGDSGIDTNVFKAHSVRPLLLSNVPLCPVVHIRSLLCVESFVYMLKNRSSPMN